MKNNLIREKITIRKLLQLPHEDIISLGGVVEWPAVVGSADIVTSVLQRSKNSLHRNASSTRHTITYHTKFTRHKITHHTKFTRHKNATPHEVHTPQERYTT